MTGLLLAVQQAAKMNADDLAAIPGATERIVGGRHTFGRGRRGGSDCGVVERASLQCALGGLGAYLRRRHRAERDAGSRNTTTARRQMRRQRDHRTSLRLDPGDLAIAECGGARKIARIKPKGGSVITLDRKSTRLNSSHSQISYAV